MLINRSHQLIKSGVKRFLDYISNTNLPIRFYAPLKIPSWKPKINPSCVLWIIENNQNMSLAFQYIYTNQMYKICTF